jgi:hypothetical protein
MTFEHTIGTRAQVWHGTAEKTSGGLTKKHLMMNKHGRIVSKRKHASGKKTIKHLKKLGYVAKKGEFILFHKGHKGAKGHKKMRGGTGAPMGAGLQGTPTGNAMAGIAQPLPTTTPGAVASGMSAGMMNKKGGTAAAMSKAMTTMPTTMPTAMPTTMNAGTMNKKGGANMPTTMPTAMPTTMNAGTMYKKGGRRHHSRKMRGGCHVNYPLSPSPYDGEGLGTSGVALQFVAGNAN